MHEPTNEITHKVYIVLEDIDIFIINQMGTSPVTSNRWRAYVVILYTYDPKTIMSVSIKTQQKINRYIHMIKYMNILKWRDKIQNLQKLDNETTK